MSLKLTVQQQCPITDVRPGHRIDHEGQTWIVDEVMIGREHWALACLPSGRSDGRRRVFRFAAGADVARQPDEGEVTALLQRIGSKLGGQWGQAGVIGLGDEWQVHVDGGLPVVEPLAITAVEYVEVTGE